MSIVLSLLRQVIVFIPLILLIPKLLGLNGVWAAQPLGRYNKYAYNSRIFNKRI